MGWSTAEVAALAGTTVNTVRHYHRTGLLEQPERLSNGYKQYRARHLVRLLQIRRLRDLGVPLAQIETVQSREGGAPAEALLAIDADLATTIERLQRARAEIRAILDGSSATDVPSGFEDVADRMSEADRSLMLVYSQLYDDAAMADLKHMVITDPVDLTREFDALPADAAENVRQEFAQRFAPLMARYQSDYPWLLEPTEHLTKSARIAQETQIEAITAVYNSAQLDVLGRAVALVAAQRAADAAASKPPEE